MKRPILLILAAGMGSRFGGLKQIEPLGPNGEIILDYTLYDAWRAGFEKAVLVIRREHIEEFKRILGRYDIPMEISFAFQDMDDLPRGFSVPEGRSKPWGTGHAILAARDQLDDVFGVVNADDFYGAQTFELLYDTLLTSCDEKTMSMVGFVLENTLSPSGGVSRGVCVTKDGKLVSIQECHGVEKVENGVRCDEKTELMTGRETVSMNVFGMSDKVLRRLSSQFRKFLRGMGDPLKDEYYIPLFVSYLISSGVTCVCRASGEKWQGVTYRQDADGVRAAFRRLHEDGVYPDRLFPLK